MTERVVKSKATFVSLELKQFLNQLLGQLLGAIEAEKAIAFSGQTRVSLPIKVRILPTLRPPSLDTFYTNNLVYELTLVMDGLGQFIRS